MIFDLGEQIFLNISLTWADSVVPCGGLWAGTGSGVPLRRVGWLLSAQADGLAMAVDHQPQYPPPATMEGFRLK